MPEVRQVAVLGLGRFGQAVARELTRLGHDVLAIDMDERIVQEIGEHVTHSVQADVTDLRALKQLGVGDVHTAIVSVSSNVEASVLAIVLLRQIGVKRIIAKAANQLHGAALQQVGATRVVYPEHETGLRVAHSFAAPAVKGYLDAAPGYGFARVPADVFAGQRLGESELRKLTGISVIALYRKGTITLQPMPSEVLKAGDELIVAGRDEDLERLPGTATSNEGGM